MSFGLSIIINYQVIFLLSMIGFLSRVSLFSLIFCEIFAFVWLYRKSPWWNKSLSSIWTELGFSQELYHKGNIRKLTLIFILIVMGIIILKNTGLVFQNSDAVYSWNRWAVQWYESKNPVTNGGLSPQLIPANWSIVYFLTNSPDLQFFARFIMPFFLLFMSLALYDLAKVQKYNSMLLSSITTLAFILYLPTMHVVDGFMELPVAFFSLASVYMLLKVIAEESNWDLKRLILAFIFAAGAALTKQEGVFFAFFFSIALFDYLRKRYDYKYIFKIYLILGIIFFLLVLPWYTLALINLSRDLFSFQDSRLNIKAIQGVPLYSIPFFALQRIANRIGLSLLVLIAGLNIYSIYKDRTFRKISFWFILLYLVVWIFLAGKVPRNLNIIIPFVGMGAGIGIYYLFSLTKYIPMKAKYWFLTIATLYIILSINNKFNFDTLQRMSFNQRNELGDPLMNNYIQKYFKDPNNSNCKVLTNYKYLIHIPSLADRGIYYHLHLTEGVKEIISDNQNICLIVMKVRPLKGYENIDKTREFLGYEVEKGKIKFKETFNGHRRVYLVYETIR